MTQREFMQELLDSLAEELSSVQVEENRRFYEAYFAQEKQKGRSEAEILAELGDPRLIAMTIIETAALKGETAGSQGANDYGYGRADEAYRRAESGTHSYGYDKQEAERSGFGGGRRIRPDIVIGGIGGLGCIIGLLVFLLFAVISVVLLKFMLPVILIIAIIGLILSMFRKS
ncbi:MAG: DUF1700 domain-containing protein [Lachnospiraceae bacterium]|nr:DUF1700 domain-containing protein [Lachnospiraceae bacterium]MDY5742164.1 DUF1700 domain-containing protein [Lachnospiraceae bacterium]